MAPDQHCDEKLTGQVHELPRDGWHIEDVGPAKREITFVVSKPQACGEIIGLNRSDHGPSESSGEETRDSD